MKGLSIVMAIDDGDSRLALLRNTISHYMRHAYAGPHEFLFVTRKLPESAFAKFTGIPWRRLAYEWNGPDEGFNPAMAHNAGVREAKYDSVILTQPEVYPVSNVLAQFADMVGQNVSAHACRDQQANGELWPMIQPHHNHPITVLCLFNKADLLFLNGWDEDFCGGYGYEDGEFGARWKRAGLPWSWGYDIQCIHQYHPRGSLITPWAIRNREMQAAKIATGAVRCKNGISKEA